MNYDGLIRMVESNDDGDIALAEAIIMKMDLNEISKFITYWGSQKIDNRTYLSPQVFSHLSMLHKKDK